MQPTPLAVVIGLALVGATLAVSQELTQPTREFATGAGGIVTVTEGDHSWRLEPEGPGEQMDLRVMGINANPFRAQKFGFYAKLATHILIVVDQQLANEIYHRDGCEKKAADLARAMFIVAAPEAFRTLQLMKLKKWLPAQPRRCASLSGAPYHLTKFHFKNTDNSHQMEQMKLQTTSTLPGLNPVRVWIIESAQEKECD